MRKAATFALQLFKRNKYQMFRGKKTKKKHERLEEEGEEGKWKS